MKLNIDGALKLASQALLVHQDHLKAFTSLHHSTARNPWSRLLSCALVLTPIDKTLMVCPPSSFQPLGSAWLTHLLCHPYLSILHNCIQLACHILLYFCAASPCIFKTIYRSFLHNEGILLNVLTNYLFAGRITSKSWVTNSGKKSLLPSKNSSSIQNHLDKYLESI